MDSDAAGNNTMKYFMGAEPNYDQLRAAALSHATQAAPVQQRTLGEAVRRGIAMTRVGLQTFAQAWKDAAGPIFRGDLAHELKPSQFLGGPKPAPVQYGHAPDSGRREPTMAERLPGIVALDMARGAEPLMPTMDAIVAQIKENPGRVPALAKVVDATSGAELQRWSPDVMADVSQQLARQYAAMMQDLMDSGVIESAKQGPRSPRQAH